MWYVIWIATGSERKLCSWIDSYVSSSLFKEEECYLIDSAYGSEGVLEASIGEIEGDRVKIMSGPLKGLEGSIKSINRHKRLATIELTLFGRTSRVVMGLEIISKS